MTNWGETLESSTDIILDYWKCIRMVYEKSYLRSGNEYFLGSSSQSITLDLCIFPKCIYFNCFTLPSSNFVTWCFCPVKWIGIWKRLLIAFRNCYLNYPGLWMFKVILDWLSSNDSFGRWLHIIIIIYNFLQLCTPWNYVADIDNEFSIFMVITVDAIDTWNCELDTGHFFHTSPAQCLIFLGMSRIQNLSLF